MITDKLLDAWKRWVLRGTSLPVAMRDDNDVKVYPGIYIEKDQPSRFESAGIKDGNTFKIEFSTKLVTTPGDDSQQATSKAQHDILRDGISANIMTDHAEPWLDGQLGIRVFQLLLDAPETTEEGGYRVTTWKGSAVACSI